MSDTEHKAFEQDIHLDGLDVGDDISDVNWMDALPLIVLVVLVVLVAVQFFTRYVLNDSLGWTEEIASYCLIILSFLGGVSCVRKGKHIFLEFFYRYIPRNKIKALALSSECITALFFYSFSIFTLELSDKTSGQNMVSVDLPKSIIYYVVSAGAFLMGSFSLIRIISLYRASAEDVARDKLDVHI
ncbi:TRAP transporter small permease [Hirschia litorea]|uniref:TRAP transporter small permease protein n=1 Tax=Hirschia litorea TaxID=1199156 RepID=A0ABW2IPD0_9PROT